MHISYEVCYNISNVFKLFQAHIQGCAGVQNTPFNVPKGSTLCTKWAKWSFCRRVTVLHVSLIFHRWCVKFKCSCPFTEGQSKSDIHGHFPHQWTMQCLTLVYPGWGQKSEFPCLLVTTSRLPGLCWVVL